MKRSLLNLLADRVSHFLSEACRSALRLYCCSDTSKCHDDYDCPFGLKCVECLRVRRDLPKTLVGDLVGVAERPNVFLCAQLG